MNKNNLTELVKIQFWAVIIPLIAVVCFHGLGPEYVSWVGVGTSLIMLTVVLSKYGIRSRIYVENLFFSSLIFLLFFALSYFPVWLIIVVTASVLTFFVMVTGNSFDLSKALVAILYMAQIAVIWLVMEKLYDVVEFFFHWNPLPYM